MAKSKIFTKSDWERRGGSVSLPDSYILKRRSKVRIEEVLENDGIGILFCLVNDESKVRIKKYTQKKTALTNNEFVILKEVLLDNILVRDYVTLNIYICNQGEYLIVSGTDELTNDDPPGTGGEGIKVKIPA